MSATPSLASLPTGPARHAEAARPAPQRAEAPLPPHHASASVQAGERRGTPAAAHAAASSVFVPLLIFFAAWLAWAVFQAAQLHEENKSLQSLKSNQEQQVQQAQRVRQTLDALASETKRLADAGNPNARLVIDELARRGITVNPAAPPAPPPAK